MKKNDKQFVLTLAEESAKLNQNLTLSDFSNKFNSFEITGWNGESSFSIKTLKKSFFDRSSRNPIEKKTYSDPPMFNPSKSVLKNQTFHSRRKKANKFPNIIPKVMIPKFHFVHAPFQINFSSRFFDAETQISLTGKQTEPNSPVKVSRKGFFDSDLNKKPVSEPIQTKTAKTSLESALDLIKTLKPRSFNKVDSALD